MDRGPLDGVASGSESLTLVSAWSTCDAAGAAALPLASVSAILLKAGSSGSVKRIVTSVGAAASAFAAGSLDIR